VEFRIIPYIGVGCIKFGMKREDIRKCFNNQFVQFRKTPFSETLTDDFGCCHVFYKKQKTCEAIELFKEAGATINNKRLVGEPYAEVRAMFEAIDETIVVNDDGFTSFKYGIGVYAPLAKEQPEEPVEAIIVFEKGYYD
jgi:hypothetical protein